jgi:hypothetical protein
VHLLLRRRVLGCVVSGFALIGTAGVSRASVVVQDSFLVPPYTGAADATGQNPATTGATASWNASTLLDIGAAGTGLSFPSSYSTAANTDRALAWTGSTAVTNGNRIGTRAITTPAAVGSSNVTVWTSGLLQINDTDNIGRATWGFIGTSTAPNVTNTLGSAAASTAQTLVGFGYLNGNAVVLPNNDAASAVSLTTLANASVNINDNTTHFFVRVDGPR